MTYPVGAFFVAQVGGVTGWWIGTGQALAGAPSRYEHAGIVISADGQVIEAEPGGARVGNLDAYSCRVICDGPILSLPESQRAEARGRVASAAHALLGRGYSWLDYLALALLHLHLPDGWVRRRVQSSGRLICSQLVDLSYQMAGLHLFTDGRLPGDVMPSDLAAWADDWRPRRDHNGRHFRLT